MDAAVRIEKGGKPTVVIASPPFRAEVISHSEMHGIPYLPFVVANVSQHVIPLIAVAIEKEFDKMVKALTIPAEELQKKIPGEIN